MKNAIVLCSGGLDSVTTAYHVRKKLKYENLIFLFFDYGQRTLKQERNSAKKCAKKLGAVFREIILDELKRISASLINKKTNVKRIKRKDLKDSSEESAKYYVPCRNTVFLVYALALAESLFLKDKKVYDIFVGFKCEGKEAYPDTTLEFVREINQLRKVSTSVKGSIIAPLIKKDKDEIIQIGKKLNVKFGETYSCYVGTDAKHCGCCLSCRLRQEGFYWAGVKDPTKYKIKMKDFRLAKN